MPDNPGTSTPVLPLLDDCLTFPQAVDFHWKHNSTRAAYVYNEEGSLEVTEVSFLEFGRACHRAAHALRPGRSGKDKTVVAFIAHADTIVYQAVVIGLMTAGLVPFAMSPRNTPAAIVHMLKSTSCHRLVATQVTLAALLDGVKSELKTNSPEYELVIDEMPSLDELYPKLGKETVQDPFEVYPYVDPSLDDIALYLHSSGSTGFPKSIPQTHLIMAHWSASPPVISFRDHQPPVRVAAMPLPAFHTLGVFTQILYPLFGAISIGVYPPVVKSKEMLPVMPTPDNILDHTRRTKSNAMISVPALLQVWAQSKEAVELLSSLEFVGYSGGSVAPKLGDFMVASGVKLNPGYGGTEFGSPTYPIPRKGDENDWAYMEFGDRLKIRWEPQGDGTYECQFLTSDSHRLPIENLPDVKGYATSDLWEKHPTKDHLWKIIGRIDDVLIHSSGEKTVPAPMEDIVMSSPYVMGTVMFGREHDQPGILIEPKPEYAIDVGDEVQLAGLRNKFWSIIEEANSVAPAFSRIFKEMILISSKEKPLPRTGKGTVMRKMALKAYDEEIEGIYAIVESSAKGENVVPPKIWTKDEVQLWLQEQAADIHSGKTFSVSRDLFEQGFDSLSATIIRRRIIGALKSSKDAAALKAAEAVTQNAVYNHPTIENLAAFIVGLVVDPLGQTGLASGKASIEAMIEKYSAGLDTPIPRASSSSRSVVVLLSGSTGNLGSQILSSLLEDQTVDRVYALNRASAGTASIVDRHRERFQDKALDDGLLSSSKLVFVEGDAAQDNLGLAKNIYDELRESVTIIIHNAWKLDFNLSLSSFEPNVRGTRNLIDFARSSAHASSLRFLFTSSVASAQSWDKAKGPFPEEVITDAGVAVGNGYGEGKYVSERILAKSGLQVSSFRIGQISGGLPNGAWATSDWLPILVKSSVALGALPSATGVVSWLPMDGVSKAILDTAFSSHQPPIALNLVHPKPIEWNTVINYIGEALHQERSEQVLPVVSFQEWYALLEKRAKSASDADIQKIPAIKLLEFFRSIANADVAATTSGQHDSESGGLSSFATGKVQNVSYTIRGILPLEARDAQRWVQYWNRAGLFDKNGVYL